LDDELLGHHGFELVVDQVDAADASRRELLDRGVGHRDRVLERKPLEDTDGLVTDVEPEPAEELATLAPDQPERDLAAPSLGSDELPRGLDDVGVEAA